MDTYGRTYTAARRDQGFKSQAHLDAFFSERDHKAGCAHCRRAGEPMWLEGSASFQPTLDECPVGTALYLATIQFDGTL